jgi:hypothetical protein
MFALPTISPYQTHNGCRNHIRKTIDDRVGSFPDISVMISYISYDARMQAKAVWFESVPNTGVMTDGLGRYAPLTAFSNL